MGRGEKNGASGGSGCTTKGQLGRRMSVQAEVQGMRLLIRRSLFRFGFVAIASRQQLCGYFDIGTIVARLPTYDYGCFVCVPSRPIVVGNVDCDDLFLIRYIAYIE